MNHGTRTVVQKKYSFSVQSRTGCLKYILFISFFLCVYFSLWFIFCKKCISKPGNCFKNLQLRFFLTHLLIFFNFSFNFPFCRFLRKCPDYEQYFPSYDSTKSEEDLKESFEFENDAMNIFGLFDDVVNHLEDVDLAIKEISQVFSSNEKIADILTVCIANIPCG